MAATPMAAAAPMGGANSANHTCKGRTAVRPRSGIRFPSNVTGRIGERARTPDVPYEAGAFHQPDHGPAQIGLPPMEAVARGGRIGMVVVVPAFPERHETENKVVPALVGRLVGTAAPYVAHRVDREGDLQRDKVSEQAAPQQSDEGIVCGSADDEPGNRRDRLSGQV